METETVAEGIVDAVKNKMVNEKAKFVLRLKGDDRWFDGFGHVKEDELQGAKIQLNYKEVCPEGYERPFFNIVDGKEGITVLAKAIPVAPKQVPVSQGFQSATTRTYDSPEARESIQMQVCLKVAGEVIVSRIAAGAALKDLHALEMGCAVEVGQLAKAIYAEVFTKKRE